MSQPTGHIEPPEAKLAVEAVPDSIPPLPTPGSGLPVRVIMAGGGTGGHVYPGLAVAEILRRWYTDQLHLVWAATPRPIDQRLLAGFSQDYVAQPVRTLTKKPWQWWPFLQAWRKSCNYWRSYFQQHSVHAVLALGGYAAAPAAVVASEMRIPLAVLNPDSVPGVTNRFLMRRADQVFTQWDLPAAALCKYAAKTVVTGCPIRPSLTCLSRQQAALRLQMDPDRPTLVITGASLGAKTINDAIIALLDQPDILGVLQGSAATENAGSSHDHSSWQILHLTGLGQATAARTAASKFKPGFWKVLEYADDMAAVWAMADLAIARAGAGLCAELTACGVPAILLPYPFHRDNHQQANAAHLTAAGAARMVTDAKDAAINAAALRPVLVELLSHPTTLQTMAQASRRLGRPQAAADVARRLILLMTEKVNSR